LLFWSYGEFLLLDHVLRFRCEYLVLSAVQAEVRGQYVRFLTVDNFFDDVARIAAGSSSRTQALRLIGGALGGAALALLGVGCSAPGLGTTPEQHSPAVVLRCRKRRICRGQCCTKTQSCCRSGCCSGVCCGLLGQEFCCPSPKHCVGARCY